MISLFQLLILHSLTRFTSVARSTDNFYLGNICSPRLEGAEIPSGKPAHSYRLGLQACLRKGQGVSAQIEGG